MTKEDFFNDIEDIKSDRIFITDSVDDVDKEIETNCWSISMSDEIASMCTIDELARFLRDVKADRKEQLKETTVKAGLIYYVWVDGQAGQLRFNFINSGHSRLPFGAPLTLVDSENEILRDYLERPLTYIETVKVFQELIGV